MFLDHFFGENHFFGPFRPNEHSVIHGWKARDLHLLLLFFSPCEASDFRGRSRTDFLHDLRLRLNLSPEVGGTSSDKYDRAKKFYLWLVTLPPPPITIAGR